MKTKSHILLLLVGFLITTNCFSEPVIDCKIHKLYCAMVELQPAIDKDWAFKFSDILYTTSKRYRTNPYRTIAMMMQESSLLGRQRTETGYIFTEVCMKTEDSTDDDDLLQCEEVAEKVTIYTDVGWFQFHWDTIERMRLDPVRLKNDLIYATEWHIRLLRIKMDRCRHLGKEAWSCYHSATEKYRKAYIKKVEPYYRRIK